MPASPCSSTAWPSPSIAFSHRLVRKPSSVSRPISGVKNCPLLASKAVGRSAGAQHPIDRNRCADALEHLRAKRLNLEEALHEAQRRLAHDQATRRCQALQTCGNIGRFANDAVTKALLANSQFTDDNRASVDTAAGFETFSPKLR